MQLATSIPSLPTLSRGGRVTSSKGPGGSDVGGRGVGSTGRRQPRLYVLTHQDAQPSNAVVAGTFQVNFFDAYVLFDLWSTHSYVSLFFASCFSEPPVLLNHSFWVSTPIEGALLVQSLYKSCMVSVDSMEMLVYLMLLGMVDFDVILGMDWLASCHTTVDW